MEMIGAGCKAFGHTVQQPREADAPARQITRSRCLTTVRSSSEPTWPSAPATNWRPHALH